MELFPGEMAAKKMDALGERFESEVEEMKTTIEGRFFAMEDRFNNVEGRFNNLEEMFKLLSCVNMFVALIIDAARPVGEVFESVKAIVAPKNEKAD